MLDIQRSLYLYSIASLMDLEKYFNLCGHELGKTMVEAQGENNSVETDFI